MHFMDAVKYVQEKEGCTDKSAAEQLVTAIVDQALAARWDDEAGLKRITPSEFSDTLMICLDGVGFVKRNDQPTAKAKAVERWTTYTYPKLQFVNGPVIDADLRNAPYSEVNTFHYIPLLVLKEDMDRWPLEDFSAEARKTARKNVRRIVPEGAFDDEKLDKEKLNEASGAARRVSRKQLLEVTRMVYRIDPLNQPNVNKAQELIRKKLPGATRKRMMPILNLPEFAQLRRRAGGSSPNSKFAESRTLGKFGKIVRQEASQQQFAEIVSAKSARNGVLLEQA